MKQLALIKAYRKFMSTAQKYLIINNDDDYRAALAALEDILEYADDTKNDPFNPLIDMLSHAIDQYESKDKELMKFVAEAEGPPRDI